MSRRSIIEQRRQTRREALQARDRFYREAADGEVPDGLTTDLLVGAAMLHDVVALYEPVGQHRDFAGVDFVERIEDPSVSSDEIDLARCVTVIDELDAAAREYGAPEVDA